MLKFTEMLPEMVYHPPFSLGKYIKVFEQIRKCKTLKFSAWLVASLQLLDNVTTVVASKVRIMSHRSSRSVQCLD
jgi:hypothetical protein